MPTELIPTAILTVVTALILVKALRASRPAPVPIPVRADRARRAR
jgi:hypothetical protein